MKKSPEVMTDIDRLVLQEVYALRSHGLAEDESISNTLTHGIVRKERDEFDRFVIGFNPLAPAQEGEIGKAIDASAAAEFSIGSVARWNIFNRERIKTPYSLRVIFVSPPDETHSRHIMNHAFILGYTFGGEITVSARQGATIERKTEGSAFVFQVIDAIKRVSHVEEVAPPSSSDSVQKP